MNTRPLEGAIGATAIADGLLAVWRIAAHLLRALRHRRQVAELMQMEDRMLRDIGVTRLDVHRALALPISQDPSNLLVRIRNEGRQSRRWPCINDAAGLRR